MVRMGQGVCVCVCVRVMTLCFLQQKDDRKYNKTENQKNHKHVISNHGGKYQKK